MREQQIQQATDKLLTMIGRADTFAGRSGNTDLTYAERLTEIQKAHASLTDALNEAAKLCSEIGHKKQAGVHNRVI